MNLNSLFFPAPRDHYSIMTHFGEMIYIPKMVNGDQHTLCAPDASELNGRLVHIPCLFIQKRVVNKMRATSFNGKENSREASQNGKPEQAGRPTKVILYFHGNAEDCGSSYDLLLKISIAFRCSVMAMEYPGYGMYKSESASAELIEINAGLVLNYLIETLQYLP